MKSDDGYEYKSYLPDRPSCYLDITKKWTEKFEKNTKWMNAFSYLVININLFASKYVVQLFIDQEHSL